MSRSRGDDALGTRAGPLHDGLSSEVPVRYLEGRIAEIESRRCASSDFSDADLCETAVAQWPRLLHRADRDDLRRALAKATAAVKARKTSMIATAPVARFAPSSKLPIRISRARVFFRDAAETRALA
ncbi:MAG TPA: hypothetical protein VHY76_15400 [Acetobacteraceae bacterium]|jgi:hypothetical protein|nr:hypothetical protein [Acetobacteraceae bacterium]